MQCAINEISRRRGKQVAFNEKNGIVRRTVSKAVADVMEGAREAPGAARAKRGRGRQEAKPTPAT